MELLYISLNLIYFLILIHLPLFLIKFNWFRINLYPYNMFVFPFYLIKPPNLPRIFQHGEGRIFKVLYLFLPMILLIPSFIFYLITLVSNHHLSLMQLPSFHSLLIFIYYHLFLMIPRVPSLVVPFKNFPRSSKGATP